MQKNSGQIILFLLQKVLKKLLSFLFTFFGNWQRGEMKAQTKKQNI